MSRYSAAHKRETRSRILAASDSLLKQQGAAGSTVDAVMRQAGLTVGGFYAHFASKDELGRETLLFGLEASMERLLRSLAGIDDDRAWARALIHLYLQQAEDPNLDHACPLTLLLPEVARAGSAWQTQFAERTARLLDRFAARFPAAAGLSPREVAIAVFASCAGAVALARTVPAPQARARILDSVESMLTAAFGLGDPVPVQTGTRAAVLAG